MLTTIKKQKKPNLKNICKIRINWGKVFSLPKCTVFPFPPEKTFLNYENLERAFFLVIFLHSACQYKLNPRENLQYNATINNSLIYFGRIYTYVVEQKMIRWGYQKDPWIQVCQVALKKNLIVSFEWKGAKILHN